MKNFLCCSMKRGFRGDASPVGRLILFLVLYWMCFQVPVMAQAVPFVGIQGGVATLSSDARAVLTPQGLNTSVYTPANGPAINLFGGAHLTDYLSVQGSYIWNSNDLTLSSSSPISNIFYQQSRTSSQAAFIVDFLVYFRRLNSRLRPYLAVGTGIDHFASRQEQLKASGGTPVLPPVRFSSTHAVLHVPVGIDVALTHRVAFRYSFSETIRHNDIGGQLSPPGNRSLANFQNLFGIVFRF